MRLVRTILKINFAISAVAFIAWVFFRLWQGLPVGTDHTKSVGPAWLDAIIGELLLVYLFLLDRKISEVFVRGIGLIGTIGLLIEVLVICLRAQAYDSPWPKFGFYELYIWPSALLCALFGRRPFSIGESAQLTVILSKLGRGL